jgi:primosomal protein N' (replication factor Y)
MIRRYRVLVPVPIDVPGGGLYDYTSDDATLEVGDYVEVSFGKRALPGVVWAVPDNEAAETFPLEKLKKIQRRFDVPKMPELQRSFLDWVARYTITPLGAILKMSLTAPDALETPPGLAAVRRVDPSPLLKMTPARQRVLDLLTKDQTRIISDLTADAGCGASVIKGLIEAGCLQSLLIPQTNKKEKKPNPDHPGTVLSEDQAIAAAILRERCAGGASVSVLDGVTGAGKTEIYLEAVAETLRRGLQVLILLPEIALGHQAIQRFHHRFGVSPSLWHSDVTDASRRHIWRGVALGDVPVVVGARSALFLPFAQLGLIVVDEEHDPSFKQEEGVIYNARDMAVLHGHLGHIPVVLTSATPSLETVHNIDTGRYHRLYLPMRHGQATLPRLQAIDMRKNPAPRGEWLAPPLRQAMVKTLEKGEQTLLFLNRRGYAPLTLCKSCGHRFECPNCTAWLVDHRLYHRLSCHHCGHSVPSPKICPECEAEDSLAACGPGVERVAEEAAMLFPTAKIVQITSDSAAKPAILKTMLAAIHSREIDIIIGTQIMAKGHHFPFLTLVGVVDADLGMRGGDLRAAERTFQVLQQVAGRAGRGDRPGRAMLQTWMPETPLMKALLADDRDGFMYQQLAERAQHTMPPFGRLVGLIISGTDRGQVETTAHHLARAAPNQDNVRVFGPAAAPLAMLRGRHRYRLLMKTGRQISPQKLVKIWLDRVDIPAKIRVQIDIDPYSFM